MSDDNYPLEWHLHFGTTVPTNDGTKSMDLYSIRNVDTSVPAIAIGVPHGDVELVNMILNSLNGLKDYLPHKHFNAVLSKIFYGPWIVDELTKTRYVRVTDLEERKIRQILFKESAERVMAEANYETLKKDFVALQKAMKLQEQMLLRLQHYTPDMQATVDAVYNIDGQLAFDREPAEVQLELPAQRPL